MKLRRDWKKLLALLHASALLFQKHRPKITLPNGETAIVATLEDYENLLYIMPAFEETLIDLSRYEKNIFDVMKSEGQEEYSTKELVILAHRYGWKVSDRRVRQVLDDLIGKGYVVVERRGTSNYYSVVRNYERIELEKIKALVVEDLKEFAVRRGLEISEMIGNQPDSPENPGSMGQNREKGDSEEMEINIERGAANTVDKGLVTPESVSVSVSSEKENPGVEPQNREKTGNREISDNFRSFRSPPCMKNGEGGLFKKEVE